ncbi:MAG: UTP--glucose-1-phosphate uridylyltransferase [Candidatus Nealsonbacteria bacterium]|nr:UTP--glucose-1-phosphate uridylyltransferase [Candidatus Nealsonbacteria bacterium]
MIGDKNIFIMSEVKKAIIPIAGLSTRFLPLSKAVPKELWPLVDLPMIQYVITEAKNAGIKEIIFVLRPENKKVLDYLKPSPKIDKILKERKKENILNEMKGLENLFKDISFSYVLQKRPLGDGNAIFQAAKLVAGDNIACLFGDDIIDSKTPVISQLAKVFKTCQKPVIALYQVPREKISHYGAVKVEKIAHRFYKIKKIIEKPSLEETPSDLAIVGRYILTPEVFDYLKKARPSKKGEVILAEVFNNQMLREGKVIYGYEIEGNWLECGDKLRWLKSNLYFSLKHPQYGPELKNYLKEMRF